MPSNDGMQPTHKKLRAADAGRWAGKSDMHHRRAALAASLALLLVSCASAPNTPNKFGHHYEYPYETPAHVSAADDDECSRRADSEAFAAVRGMSNTPALLFGAIGAVAQLDHARNKLNTTYEQVMKSCLRAKGYEIPN